MKLGSRMSFRIATTAAIVLLGVPIGYALADSVDPDGSDESVSSWPPSLEQLSRMEPHPTVPAGDREVDYAIEGQPDPSKVQECRSDPRAGGAGDPVLCDAILAVASGKLEPGEYTAAEVKAASGE